MDLQWEMVPFTPAGAACLMPGKCTTQPQGRAAPRGNCPKGGYGLLQHPLCSGRGEEEDWFRSNGLAKLTGCSSRSGHY